LNDDGFAHYHTGMHRCWILLTIIISCQAENWPSWRGLGNDGSSAEARVPTQWDSSKNVAWKTAIPGTGHSSPIVWGNQVFLTSCIEDKGDRILISIDRITGNIEWTQTVLNASLESIHRLNSRASSTPATNGKQIFVSFLKPEGEEVLAPNVGAARMITPGRIILSAYDLQGQQQWQRDLGDFLSAHGFNSCPVLYKDLVIINGDHDGKGYLVAIDQATGNESWRVDRPHNTRSYGTPFIRQIGARTQMVLPGSHSVYSYDPDNGKVHWFIDGPTEQFVASMVYDEKYFYLTCGYPERHIVAIDPDGSGNVTETHIAWREQRGAAYVPSPIVAGDFLLVVADSGILSCFEARTGERLWMERLKGGHSASPVSANGLVYYVSDQGITSVIRPGQEFQLLETNDLEEKVSSSPAISQGQIFIRTHDHLYCIGDH